LILVSELWTKKILKNKDEAHELKAWHFTFGQVIDPLSDFGVTSSWSLDWWCIQSSSYTSIQFPLARDMAPRNPTVIGYVFGFVSWKGKIWTWGKQNAAHHHMDPPPLLNHHPNRSTEPAIQQTHQTLKTSVKFWDYRSIPSDHIACCWFWFEVGTNFNLTNRIKGLSHIFLVHWSTQWPCNHLPVTERKLQHPTCMCTHTHTHTHTHTRIATKKGARVFLLKIIYIDLQAAANFKVIDQLTWSIHWHQYYKAWFL
jgi:hypothetical protein